MLTKDAAQLSTVIRINTTVERSLLSNYSKVLDFMNKNTDPEIGNFQVTHIRSASTTIASVSGLTQSFKLQIYILQI